MLPWQRGNRDNGGLFFSFYGDFLSFFLERVSDFRTAVVFHPFIGRQEVFSTNFTIRAPQDTSWISHQYR